MKLILPLVAGLALVACKSTSSPVSEGTALPAETVSDVAPNVQSASFHVEGMT